ncbi:MAG: hypothetical protein WC750_04960 [Patescibacteria group bacterium]|jgi:hypothetical protein
MSSRVIEALGVLFAAVLVVAIGGAMGSTVCFLSHYSVVGAIVLASVLLTGLIIAGYLLSVLSELLGSLVAVFVASPRGYDITGSGMAMGRAMKVRVLSGLGTLITVGAVIGVLAVR